MAKNKVRRRICVDLPGEEVDEFTEHFFKGEQNTFLQEIFRQEIEKLKADPLGRIAEIRYATITRKNKKLANKFKSEEN